MHQRVQEDPFRCAAVTLVGVVHSTPPGRLTHVDPVGGTVTSAAVVLFVHQGLQQQRPDVVMSKPVGGQLAGAEGQYVTGQMLDLYPGQEKETTLTDEVLEFFPPGVFIPADPLVPGLHPPGGAGVLQDAQGLGCRFGGLNQVTQMRTEGGAIAQVVVLLKEFGGVLALLRGLGQQQPDRLEGTQRESEWGTGGWIAAVKTSARSGGASGAFLRQAQRAAFGQLL